MKKLLKVIMALVVSMGVYSYANAQNKEVQKSQLYKLYQMKYVFAMKYNDGEVAKDALYNMIAMDPGNDSLKMVLCYYYFERNQNASSLFVSADLLSRNPDNIDALKINAMSYENMGIRDKAIEQYLALNLKTQDIGALFQAAQLQFDLERFNECKTSLDIIIKNPQAKALKLSFAKNENEQQQITMEAAAYNLKGMIEKQQGNKAEAKSLFEKALEVQPEFALASQNLKEVSK